MEAQVSKSTNPLFIAAGIAIIVFCAAGIAAIMGWIPTTLGGGSAPQALQASATPAPAVKPHTDTVKPKSSAGAATPAPTPSSAVNVAKNKCGECGVIESVREVEKAGAGTGLGAVGGAVAGGVLGNQVGGGRGQDAMTVIGAVAGGIAGNQIEKKVRSTKSYEIMVRMEDGSTKLLSESVSPSWRSGDKVKVIDGRIQPYNG